MLVISLCPRNHTLGQYIASILRWLLIEPKRKKKISLNLSPEPKRRVPWFHLNASTPRGLSKLIIQISCKKVNSRKLRGGVVVKHPQTPPKPQTYRLFMYFIKNTLLLVKSVEIAFLHLRSYLTLHSGSLCTDLQAISERASYLCLFHLSQNITVGFPTSPSQTVFLRARLFVTSRIISPTCSHRILLFISGLITNSNAICRQ